MTGNPGGGGPTGQAGQADNPPRCPNCGVLGRTGERYCLRCRCEFATGVRPRPPHLMPLRRTAHWEALVEADPVYFALGRADGVRFPTGAGKRVVRLHGQHVLIGRTSKSEGIYPQVDLSVPPEDPGVSTIHAILERQPNGSYCVVDCGSRNGTRLNGTSEPIERDLRIPLHDGDRIFVGAWSRVTIRRAATEPGDLPREPDPAHPEQGVTMPRGTVKPGELSGQGEL